MASETRTLFLGVPWTMNNLSRFELNYDIFFKADSTNGVFKNIAQYNLLVTVGPTTTTITCTAPCAINPSPNPGAAGEVQRLTGNTVFTTNLTNINGASLRLDVIINRSSGSNNMVLGEYDISFFN